MPGHFAVEVEKEQKGFFPAGTRLLLRWPDAPGDGDTVLVKLRDKKEFLFAVYTRKAREIVLTPLQKGGGKRVIPKAEFHNVCSWIVSIREAVRLF
jgi:molybdopterin-guanine dinucleotide biosynthesis protein A